MCADLERRANREVLWCRLLLVWRLQGPLRKSQQRRHLRASLWQLDLRRPGMGPLLLGVRAMRSGRATLWRGGLRKRAMPQGGAGRGGRQRRRPVRRRQQQDVHGARGRDVRSVLQQLRMVRQRDGALRQGELLLWQLSAGVDDGHRARRPC